ncbi:MAG: hypothetical protein RCG15_03415 [Candidatus Rickettsia vulgarisii]
MSKNDIEFLLSNQELEKAYNIIQDKESPEYFEYAYSPLNKNIETKIFEEIVHELVRNPDNNKNILFIKDDKKILFCVGIKN